MQGAPPESGPSADATAHAADLERQIRQRTWIAAIGIIIALAGSAVAIYLAIDARDNGASKEDFINLQQKQEADQAEKDLQAKEKQLDKEADQAEKDLQAEEKQLDKEADQAKKELDKKADKKEKQLEKELEQDLAN